MPESIDIDIGPVTLAGLLTVPARPVGLVIFAHGSGSSRNSPRNRFVAEVLNESSLSTLLFDLLTPNEEVDRRNVFDITLLADRLGSVTDWALTSHALPLGYFGASTGAGAALAAAAGRSGIGAVVSRGGRPDLAGVDNLAAVQAPTLLIVGGLDHTVEDLNRQAMAGMSCERRIEIVPGATHLFEEPGTLETVSRLATDWFRDHLTSGG